MRSRRSSRTAPSPFPSAALRSRRSDSKRPKSAPRRLPSACTSRQRAYWYRRSSFSWRGTFGKPRFKRRARQDHASPGSRPAESAAPPSARPGSASSLTSRAPKRCFSKSRNAASNSALAATNSASAPSREPGPRRSGWVRFASSLNSDFRSPIERMSPLLILRTNLLPILPRASPPRRGDGLLEDGSQPRLLYGPPRAIVKLAHARVALGLLESRLQAHLEPVELAHEARLGGRALF